MIKSILMLLLFLFTGCIEDNSETLKKRKDLQLVSFVYHRFGDNRYPTTNISLEEFEQQLRYLSENEYTVKKLSKAVELFYKHDTIPQKVVVLTIDDAYKSFLTGAYPLLKKYNMPATLFVNTQMVGKPDYLDWDEIKLLHRNGIEIGNHSHAHHYFLNFNKKDLPEKFKKDLNKADELFREHLNFIPQVYAYPYGEFNHQMKNVLRGENYKMAVAQNSGVTYFESDFFSLPRFPMGGIYTTFESFIEKLNMNALPVDQIVSSEHSNSNDLPLLKIKITDNNINVDQLQCFVNGSTNCRIIPQPDGWFTISYPKPLKERRTLYTITAPDRNTSKWYWHSHLWVQPEVAE